MPELPLRKEGNPPAERASQQDPFHKKQLQKANDIKRYQENMTVDQAVKFAANPFLLL